MFKRTRFSDGKKEWEELKKFIEKNKISDIFVIALADNKDRVTKTMLHGSIPCVRGLLQSWLDNLERETTVRRMSEESVKINTSMLRQMMMIKKEKENG